MLSTSKKTMFCAIVRHFFISTQNIFIYGIYLWLSTTRRGCRFLEIKYFTIILISHSITLGEFTPPITHTDSHTLPRFQKYSPTIIVPTTRVHLQQFHSYLHCGIRKRFWESYSQMLDLPEGTGTRARYGGRRRASDRKWKPSVGGWRKPWRKKWRKQQW